MQYQRVTSLKQNLESTDFILFLVTHTLFTHTPVVPQVRCHGKSSKATSKSYLGSKKRGRVIAQ
jgi:hypothetical protein